MKANGGEKKGASAGRAPGLWLAAILSLAAGAQLQAGTLSPRVEAWLASQAQVKTWLAEFRQTRTLKALAQPLVAEGRVWFAAPNRFRWELGRPPQTIAVRAGAELRVIYPKLKRVERFPLDRGAGQWREALALLEAGFPRSAADLENRFNVLSEKAAGASVELALQPKSSTARRLMPEIRLAFDTGSGHLLATEMRFADGSTLRNDFSNQKLNPEVPAETFSPEVPADYKVVDPLQP